MDFDLNEEQRMLREAARKFLAKECSPVFVRQMEQDERGFTGMLWQQMADLGWMGLLCPESCGGLDGSFLDMAALLHEMGFVCLPGPFFASTILGGTAVMEAGTDEQKHRILPQMAAGSKILTLAWVERAGTYAPEGISLDARLQEGYYVLSGTKLFVPDAHVADWLVCAVRTRQNELDPRDGVSLLLVDRGSPGLKTAPLSTMSGSKQCEVAFEGVRVPGESLLGVQDQGWAFLERVLLKSAVAKCAEMIGGAERVIELVTLHAKERMQFGSPIGRFQAVQHHCADILTCFHTSRVLTYQAAWRISQGLPFEKEAAMCKAWVSDAYRRLVGLGHQVMGGMGFMEEHDLQLYFRRAAAAARDLGNADFHRELVAQQMDL